MTGLTEVGQAPARECPQPFQYREAPKPKSTTAEQLARAVSLAHASGGYVYRLESSTDWRAAPDDDWEIVVASIDGNVLGRRRIDGADCVIVEQAGHIYGVRPQNLTMKRSKTMAFRNQILMPGDRLAVNGATKIIARVDEPEPNPNATRFVLTIWFTDGTHREWDGYERFWQKIEHAGTFARTATMARVKARFVKDDVAQFKKGELVYVNPEELKAGRQVWISVDPEGNRGAYGFSSDVELVAANPVTHARGSLAVSWHGRRAHLVRRYHNAGKAWFLVQTPTGDILSWPSAEATAPN